MELHLGQRAIALQSLPRISAAALPSCESTQHSEFLDFANVGGDIGANAAKLEKIRLLSDFLRSLTSEQLSIATTYFTGRAFAQSDPRILQVGWAVIFRALQDATKIGDSEFHGNAMIAKARQTRSVQRRWSINFKSIA